MGRFRRVFFACAAAGLVGGCLYSAYGTGESAQNQGDAGDADALDTPDVPPMCAADLNTDPLHCGRCGHDCLGAPCVGGKCQPGIFAAFGGAPWYMASDAQYLYVVVPNAPSATSSSILRIDKTTREFVSLAAGLAPWTYDIRVDDEYVYWTNEHDPPVLFRRSKDPALADIVKLAEGKSRFIEIARTPSRIYVTTWVDDVLYSLLPDGGDFVVQDGGLHQNEGIAFDGTHVYVGASNEPNMYRRQIQRIDPVTGTRIVFTDGLAGRRLYADDANVYATGDIMVVVPKSAGIGREIGPPLSDAGYNYGGAAYDRDFVYWVSSSDGTLYRSPKPGFESIEVLATGLSEPIAVEVDDRAVYFTLRGAGAVGFLAK